MNTPSMSGGNTPKANGLGLLTVLQTELRSISQEARSKFPAIKEASERGILKLKYIEEQSTSIETLIVALSKSEDVLKPFLMSCDTKNQKMVSIAIGSILKLISQSAVSITTLPLILSKMSMLIDIGSEEPVQLKVLQGLLILITTLHDLHDDLLAQCLVLCFRLHCSKNTSIQKTSSATLPQITRIIFDRVVLEMNNSNNNNNNNNSNNEDDHQSNDAATMELNPIGGDQQQQQQQSTTESTNDDNQQHENNNNNEQTTTTTTATNEDVSTTPNNTDEQPQQQQQEGGVSITNSSNSSPILTSSVSATASTPTMIDPVSPTLGNNNRAPPSLKPCARDAYLLLQDLCHITGGDNPCWLPPTTTISRATGLELIEMIISVHQPIFTHFISKYSEVMVTESDVLLTKSIRMLESDSTPWMQVLALESFKVYSEDPQLLRMFYKNYDKDNNAAKIFENMASSIGRYVQTLYVLDSSHYVFTNTAKNRLMDMLWQTEAPAVRESYIISVCTECITGIVNSVAEINNPDVDSFPHGMASACWVAVLAAISMLLSKAADETLIQIILKSLQSFTNTCGELHLSAPRDALLTCLCKTTTPPALADQQPSDISIDGESNSGRSSNMLDKSGNADDKNKRDQLPMLTPSQYYPTSKNILSVKTLLNIAHCMGSVLDEAWILVLETLETWDKVLKTMHQQQQQEERTSSSSSVNNVSSPRIGQGEVPILITAMNSLFKSSSQLDERSINFLFDALAKLCQQTLSKSGFQINSPTNMFAINKLVEASMANLSRIDKLWGFVSTYIVETCNHKNAYVRLFGVDSLTNIIKTALSIPAPPSSENEDDVTDEAASESEDEYVPAAKRYRKWNIERMQVEFFNTIEEISFSQYVDTKEKILESIHQILSSSGQTLSTAWPILLSILLRVAQNNEKAFIPIAFESLKLICNEFLSNLTPECLVLTIEVISAFVSQKSDINISLTASSGQLSDLTYFLANENALATSKYNTTTIEQINQSIDQTRNTEDKDSQQLQMNNNRSSSNRTRPSIPNSSPFYVERKQSVMCRMWLCAYTSMKQLCIDQRPAIRNGVIVSLFQTLTNFLHLLDKDLIETILWNILFPLIEEVKQCSELADKERIDSDLGGGVMLLVHHSRNTAQKQWDETQVLPIGRMIIVFKTFFDTLSQLPTFTKAWEKLLNILETESKSSSKEVSMASISSLHEIVNSNITDGSHHELSESVWETILRLSTKLTDSTSVAKTLTVYIKVFLDLYQKTKSSLNHAQMLRVLQILYPLGLYIPETTTDLSNPQVHTLQMIKSFPPITEELFPTLISMLLKYVSIGISYEYSPSSCEVIFPNVAITKDLVYYSLITEKSMELISELFLHPTTTNSMRASIYEDILKVFGSAIMTKYTKYHSNVWKLAVSNLIKMLPLGLLSINEDSNSLNDIKRNMIWTELIDSIQTFVLHERNVAANSLSPEKKTEEDRYDVDLINAISKEMVGFSGIRVERVSIIRDRLVEILNEGSMLSPQGREKVSQACYQNLFSVCGKASTTNSESIEIAKIILPVLLKRCKEVLQRFVVDERQSGNCPLPRHRLTEVSFILKEILNLQLQPGIYQPSSSMNPNSSALLGGKRPHLLELFTILSDCICTSEKEIKELLKNIFYIVAQEFLFLDSAPQS
ncbi:hypothetical protein PPL_08306 [Heterostelium album PN500]|uniref:Protein MON2 homolog n=1 Tax=Heterostelium pallidum (strain ATCC 26659 / Pp 5 / PN500) TaxID=670386 RepID=D3BHU1_HETP5|nr:hypothetical protein PPL_08306 [Heterostelium album PN500]EFA78841.1 hypothetical protein PPL_08306 [Heterostelium album PN500]|eukprot:XP_020430965.1 hypothetical protein PPL_08306 [Heterostelium album PN500]